MRSITRKYILWSALVVLLTFSSNASAGFFTRVDDSLLTINEVEYSTGEFSQWWESWREKDMVLPETPDLYIDWLLFVSEAERMLLFDDPQFKRDILVYLKVLSLIQLKNDEIDSKIIINDAVLWEHYEKEFAPEWTINTIIYLDEESALQAYKDLQSGKQKVEDLVQRVGERSKLAQSQSSHGKDVIDVGALKDLSASEDTLLGVQENLKKRPYTMNPVWQKAVEALTVGSFSAPIPWQDSFVILNLLNIFEGDKEDFAKRRNQVKQRYRKRQESILTNNLIEQLMKKYNVVIHEERINMIDFESDVLATSQEPVLIIGDLKVTEQQVIDMVKRDMDMNTQYGFLAEETNRLAKRVVSGIVSQTLITMESLDRHYELQSPVREFVDFKKKYKLVKKIEKQIRDQMDKVREEEIESYYNENKAEFTRPAVFHMAVISDTEEILKKIWLEVVVNKKDVMSVTEARIGYVPKKLKYPENHLDPEVKKIARKLAKGDLSQIFYANDKYNMVYMVDYIPAQTAPYQLVKGKILKKMITEKFDIARGEYLDKLKANAAIYINTKAWIKLRNDLIREDEQQ